MYTYSRCAATPKFYKPYQIPYIFKAAFRSSVSDIELHRTFAAVIVLPKF
jgi:hypothetical protein